MFFLKNSHAQYIINYLAFIIYETSSSQRFLLRNSGGLFVITGKHISLWVDLGDWLIDLFTNTAAILN